MSRVIRSRCTPGRFAVTTDKGFEIELTSGDGLSVFDPVMRSWVKATVEYSHEKRAYHLTASIGTMGHEPLLEHLLLVNADVRLWAES